MSFKTYATMTIICVGVAAVLYRSTFLGVCISSQILAVWAIHDDWRRVQRYFSHELTLQDLLFITSGSSVSSILQTYGTPDEKGIFHAVDVVNVTRHWRCRATRWTMLIVFIIALFGEVAWFCEFPHSAYSLSISSAVLILIALMPRARAAIVAGTEYYHASKYLETSDERDNEVG